MELITHEEGTMFSVLSEKDPNVSYNVDLAIGMCSCPSGNALCKHKIITLCKHIIGCSQYSIYLPQCCSFVAEHKRALAKVVYGDIPPVEFFEELNKAVHTSDSINVEEACDDRVSEVDETSSKLQLEVTSANTATIAQKADTAAEYLRSLILKHVTKGAEDSLKDFSSRMKKIKNGTQLQSFLRTAGSSLFLRNSSVRRKKFCQLTSGSRRLSGGPRGRKSLTRRRCKKTTKSIL